MSTFKSGTVIRIFHRKYNYGFFSPLVLGAFFIFFFLFHVIKADFFLLPSNLLYICLPGELCQSCSSNCEYSKILVEGKNFSLCIFNNNFYSFYPVWMGEGLGIFVLYFFFVFFVIVVGLKGGDLGENSVKKKQTLLGNNEFSLRIKWCIF